VVPYVLCAKVKHADGRMSKVVILHLVFQYCKILPDDGPYRPKHVVMFHV
jgi:hypothetical protein